MDTGQKPSDAVQKSTGEQISHGPLGPTGHDRQSANLPAGSVAADSKSDGNSGGYGEPESQGERKKWEKEQKEKSYQETKVKKSAARITFHVVISNTFEEIKDRNCLVFISFSPDEKYGSEYQVKMHDTGRGGEGGRLYETEIGVHQLRELHRKTVKYKYGMKLHNMYVWEELLTGKDHRKLYLADFSDVQKGPRHKFDWMAYPPGTMKKGWAESLKIWKSAKLIEPGDFRLCFSLFMPTTDMVISAVNSKEDEEPTVETILHWIKIVEKSAEGCQKYSGEVQHCVHDFLLAPLLEQLQSEICEEKPTVVLAMFILYMALNLNQNLTDDERHTVFRALLITPDLNRRTCPEIQILHHFPGQMAEYAMDFPFINKQQSTCKTHKLKL